MLSDKKEGTKIERRLRLRVPVATSNLGAGLDCLGLALDLNVEVTVDVLSRNDLSVPLVRLEGRMMKDSIPSDMEDLVYKIVSSFWSSDGEMLKRVRVKIVSDIPAGCGLGVKSAALVGIHFATAILQDHLPTGNELLSRAIEFGTGLEFVSASLSGGLVVSGVKAGKVIAQKLDWPQRWKIIMLLSSERIQAHAAREGLPESVSSGEALSCIHDASQFVAAVARQDAQALAEILKDTFNERLRTHQGFKQIKELLAHKRVIGTFLSGSGPAVAVVVDAVHASHIAGLLLSGCGSSVEHGFDTVVVSESSPSGVELVEDAWDRLGVAV